MLHGVLNFAKTRYQYGDATSWLLAAYSRILRRSSVPLPACGSVQKILLNGEARPLLARLGTSDFLVMEEILFHGEYAEVAEVLKEPINLIVDLGANVGYSLRFWNRAFPKAKMIAVEPDPENANLCMANVIEAGFSNLVSLHVACVGSHSRMVNLLTDLEAWAIQMEECPSGESGAVSVLTVPQLLAHLPANEPIDLLKCDIEGAEAELFADCADWIQRVRHMIVELHPPYTTQDFFEDLENSGTEFTVVSITKQEALPVIFLSFRSF